TGFIAVVRDPLAIRLGVFFLGLTTQMYRPAMQASVADLVPPERRARAYGLVYWAVNVGFGVSLSIGGALAAASFTNLFLGDAAAMLLFGLIVWRKVPETRPARAIADAAAGRSPGGLGARLGALLDDVAPLLRDRVLLVFLVLHFLFATVMFQFNVSVPIDMRRNGIGPQGYGLLMALNGITIAIVQPFAVRVLARFERARVMSVAAILLGTGYGLFAVVATPPWYAFAIVLWTLGEICHTPIATATVADLAPAALRGRYQGAYGMAWGLAMFVGTQTGADVLDRFGPTALWGGCLAVGVAVAVGQLAAAPARRRRLAVEHVVEVA
ncbi:MAG TPA: MFS transporter, partial [Anaeromyxobacteraceae bacterium]|nr:MFS transporter [Anaeromyxobacteraceae bacterium]